MPNVVLLAFALGASPRAAWAEPGEPIGAPATPPVATYALGEGAQVILEPSPSGQEIAICTGIGRGGEGATRENRAARRVLGALLEGGGFRSGAAKPSEFVHERGGDNSVWFENDALVFCTRAPSHELPLAIWVAATRFASLSVDAESLARTREAIQSELTAALADARGKMSLERVDRLTHLGEAGLVPTSEEVLQDLEAVQSEELQQLHKELFVARNTSISISGAFEVQTARELIEKHLGKIPAGTGPTRAPENRRQSTERFSTVEDAANPGTSVWYAWRAPDGSDAVAAELALRILASPARLGTTLLGSGGPASLVEARPDVRSSGVLRLFVEGRGNYAPEPIEERLDKTLSALAAAGPSQAELDDARAAMIQANKEELLTPLDRAHALTRASLRGVSPELVLRALGDDERWATVSREEISASVRTYFTKRRRSVVEVYPKGWKDPWEAPMPTFHVVSPGETLTSIARARGTTVEVIAKMNRIDVKKAIYPGDKLRVPRGKPVPKLRSHVVKSGDTLLGLGKRYGVSASAIADQNGIGAKQVIRIGQTLEIPSGSAGVKDTKSQGASSDAKAPPRVHEVKKGDSLGSIAKKWGITAAELSKANGLASGAILKIGQRLRVPEAPKQESAPVKAEPGKSLTPATRPEPNQATTAPIKPAASAGSIKPAASANKEAPPDPPAKPKSLSRTHTVRSGETLSGIAHRYHVSTRALCQANGLSEKKPLRVGQKLTIPESG